MVICTLSRKLASVIFSGGTTRGDSWGWTFKLTKPGVDVDSIGFMQDETQHYSSNMSFWVTIQYFLSLTLLIIYPWNFITPVESIR